jgi:hypothetical protein
MVETRAGPKKVEDVQVGDEVLSKDETDGTIAYKPVTTTFTREADKIYRVGIGDQTVSVTAEHPFYVHNIGWVRVENLKPGDRLDTRYGMTVELKTLDAVEQPTQVYNFSVADYHSYFVTPLQIYTHNQGPCGNIVGKLLSDNMKTRVPNNEISPPKNRGNAPISNIDHRPIEIHHEGQNPDGPFHEMHPSDHRYGDNYKKNHPNFDGNSKIDRKQFRKDTRKYWEKEWDSGRFEE